MFVLGVTGNSGSGKSSVAKLLVEKNAYIIDADMLARKVLDVDGRAYGETVEFFGGAIVNEDKTINRKVLSDIVFGEPAKLAALNEITHKHILEYIYDDIKAVSEAGQYSFIVVDAPLLFESGLDKICNSVWVVDAPHEQKLNRITKRDGIAVEQAIQRLTRQTLAEELIQKCDNVIHNDFGLDYLAAQVEGLLLKLDI